ncbi:MAG: VWA domain-containing protein [Chloroflexota bacterium]
MKQQQNEKTISLTTQVDRTLVPANETTQRYLLITLHMPDKADKGNRLPLNLGLVIDRSGSMSGQKLEYVKEAAIHTVRLLTDEDRVSVTIYDDEVEVVAPSQAVTSSARTDLIKRIRAIRTGGMTNLSGGWFTGCDQIADFMSSDYLNRALLLTDGLANKGVTDHEKLVYEGKQLRQRGITSTTFGVGNDFNQFLLQGIADGSGGHFYFIESPKQIPNYFQGELGEMLDTVAREMTLDLTLPTGVKATILNDVPHEQSDTRFRLMLGDAYANEARTLVIKLDIAEQSLDHTLKMPLHLQYEDAQTRQAMTINCPDVVLTVADKKVCEDQSVNEAVMTEAAQLEAEKGKMQALEMEYRGDVAGAKRVLQGTGTFLRTMAPNVAAPLAANLDMMQTEMEEGLTETARKEAHYATYRAQRSRKDYKK